MNPEPRILVKPGDLNKDHTNGTSFSGREEARKKQPITGHRIAKEGTSIIAELPMSDIVFNSESILELQAVIRVQQDMIRKQDSAIKTHIRQRIEQTKSAKNLRELVQKLRDLTQIIVHDIRLKLSAVTGPLFMLESREIPDETKQAQFMHMAVVNAKETVEMLEAIQDSERGIVLNKKKFNLADLVLDVAEVTRLNQVFGNKRIIETETIDTIIYGDRIRLDQLLINLVSNAQKFTEPGQTISFSIKTDSDYIYMSVSDEGQGIPKEEHESIFIKYETGDRQQGLGLGLFTVKQIAELHGGEILVNSPLKDGKGTRFTFKLPKDLQ